MKNKKDKPTNEQIERYLRGQSNAQEDEIIDAWYRNFDDRAAITSSPYVDDEALQSHLLGKITKKLQLKPVVKKPTGYKILYIPLAAAMLVAGIFALFTLSDLSSSKSASIVTAHADVFGGGNAAVVELEDGQEIDLAKLRVGKSIAIHGIAYTKTDEGKVQIAPVGDKSASGSLPMQTLRTPKGKQFTVVLPDGSTVTLNASSQISYPASFHKDKRQLQLVGEAYFSVAKNSSWPFEVITAHQRIQVLGTKFNVRAYLDQKTVHTALVEGSVRIHTERESAILKPGEQAASTVQGGLRIEKAPMDHILAWTKNQFSFDGNKLTEIMDELSRWYSIEVIYEKQPSSEEFAGTISRSASLKEVLTVLQLSGVKFRMDQSPTGDRLVVTD